MQTRLPLQSVDKIKNHCKEDALYRAITFACKPVESSLPHLTPYPEEVYLDVLRVLDDIKADAVSFLSDKLPSLWNDVFVETRRCNTSISEQDPQDYAAIIVGCVWFMLCKSDNDYYYTTMKNAFRDHLLQRDAKRLELLLSNISEMIEEHSAELKKWINRYMQDRTFLSDEIFNMLEGKTKKIVKSQGGQPAVLFCNNQYKKTEQKRFLTCLQEHALQNTIINASQNNQLNRIVVCFVQLWETRKLISDPIKAAAVYRFLTEDCKLKCDIHQSTFENHFRKWIKDDDFVDETTRKKVGESFGLS